LSASSRSRFLGPGHSEGAEWRDQFGVSDAEGRLQCLAAARHGLYLRYCVGCHGVYGDGNGEHAPYIDPKPRDSRRPRSSADLHRRNLPLDSDLLHVLKIGVEASGMPSWISLSDQNRPICGLHQDVLAALASGEAGDPSRYRRAGADEGEHYARRRTVSEDGVLEVPGQQGRGDGPSAPTLTDSKEQPIRPYNFAEAGNDSRFKCGETNQDLYRIS